MGKHKEKSKKHKREKKHKEKKSRSHSSSSSDEWVEKDDYSSSDDDRKQSKTQKTQALEPEKPASSRRHEWMSLPESFLSASNLDRRKAREDNKREQREREQYNPSQSVRELNPYWKDGGDGLPKFKKPSDDDHDSKRYVSSNRPKSSSSWRKQPEKSTPQQMEPEPEADNLSDKELNILASKLVKAEIMGKTELVKELKAKLEAARGRRTTGKQNEDIILTETDSRGHTRPLKQQSQYDGYSSQKKKRKVETHQDGQRVRYFADDDKHSLQQMFENEKFNSVDDQNREFLEMASKIRKNDDGDDIFSDNIRKKESDQKIDARNRDKAISEHRRIAQSVDTCKLCLQSEAMAKHLMVTLGDTVYLSVPPFEPLTQGHCLIIPIRHVSCSTLLDENEWSEIMDFRRALTRMYSSRNEDVVFFETAKSFDKYPHMCIECVPVDKEEGDMAPIYFKKAIDECEVEWAQNKKLVSLKGKDVRRTVPKGLPYFFVSFGMEEGFAHVIEDEKYFPNNFAQEIIGGMLDLHHSKWRKPKYENFESQSKRVVEFTQEWSEFDCTQK